jgi:hypothetical protein
MTVPAPPAVTAVLVKWFATMRTPAPFSASALLEPFVTRQPSSIARSPLALPASVVAVSRSQPNSHRSAPVPARCRALL